MSAWRARVEPFGAWIRVDDGTLVAVDQPLARRLGLDGGARWSAPSSGESAPLEVHVAVTNRCPVACEGCYQNASPDGTEVDRSTLERSLRALSAEGVFTVAFGGGEPLLRDDLGELASLARALGLTPVVTTSGIGMTPARAASLRAFAQVNVSHDGVGESYAAVRGFEGARAAERAVAMLREAGVAVGVNFVLTRQSLSALEATVERAKALGAREIQLLRYKPAGRASSLDYLTRRLGPEDLPRLGDAVRALALGDDPGFSVRIDCALVPLLGEALGDPAVLARFGVFGCEAGRHLGAQRRDGARVGCSFDTWSREGAEGFRLYVNDPPSPCRECELLSVCRGGCKVVSMHLEGVVGPDPECPRVRRHRDALPSRG